MKLDKAFIALLKSYFVSRHDPSTIAGSLLPTTNEGANLGSPQQRFDTIYARVVVSDYTGSGETNLDNHITADDHLQYVHINEPRVITAVHEFNPAVAGSPFILGANAQGQTVTGLKADQLSKQVIAGSGLSGGGTLTSDVSLNVDSAYDFTWTGDHIFQAGVSTRHIYPESNDAYDLGSSTKLWRQSFISQMNAVVFAEMTATLLGGWLVIGKNEGTFAADVASGDATVDFGKAMTAGQFVLVRAHDSLGVVKAEYLQVGSLVSSTTYNVTRDLAGVHATDPAWSKGTPYQVLGVSGDGRIELNAYDTPRMSILKQGATYGAASELVRMGDLNGWGPVSSEQYGWGVGNYAANKFAYYTETDGLIIRGTIRADSGYLGSLSIDGILAIGASGEIRQGTGVLGTDFTGLRVWRDGSIGRIGGYNSNNLQWYVSTDGKLYAGGGSVKLDSNGISLRASTSSDPESRNVLKVVDGDGDSLLSLYVFDAAALGGIFRQTWIQMVCTDDSQSEAYLRAATASTTKAAITGLMARAGTGDNFDSLSFYLRAEFDATEKSLAELSGSTPPRLRFSNTLGSIFADMWLEGNGMLGFDGILSNGTLKVGSSTAITPTTTGHIAAKYLSLDNYYELNEQSSAPGTPSSGWGRFYISSNAGNSPVYKRDTGQSHDITTDEVAFPILTFAPLQGASWEGAVLGNHIPNRMKFPNSGWPAAAGGPYLIPMTWDSTTAYFDLYFMVGSNCTNLNVKFGFNLYNCDDYVYMYNNPNLINQGSSTTTGSFITYAIYKATGTIYIVNPITRSKMVFVHIFRNAGDDSYNGDVFFIGGKMRSF